MVLLCSTLALPRETRPLTPKEWLLDAGGLPLTHDDLTGDALVERLRGAPAVHYQPTLGEIPAD